MKRTYTLKSLLIPAGLFLMILLMAAQCGDIEPPPPPPTVTAVTISPKPNSMKVGEVMNLTATVDGTNLTDKSVTWSTGNSGHATVSRGTVTGVAKGQVTITATSNADSSKSDSVTLTVNENDPLPQPSLKVSPTDQTVTLGGSAVTFAAVKQNMTDAVTWSLSAPEGTLSTTSGDQTTYTPPTTSAATSVTLTATAGSLTATAQITLSRTEPVASIDSVEIVDNGASTQIRQGFGTVTVIARGKGLEQAANARLSPANIVGTIDQAKSNNTSVTISFDIKHSVEGLQELSFDVKDVGKVTRANAITITKITFSPTGSDTGKGTPDNPFKTLEANYLTEPGDTLYLTNGIHLRTQTFFLPDGVTLEGESQEANLQASGGMGGSNGLQFVGTSRVQNLTLNSFETCAYVSFDQNVTFTDVTIQSCTQNGLLIFDNGKVTANNSTFTQNNIDSIQVDGNKAEFTMIGGESSANGWTGLWMTGIDTKVNLDGVRIVGNNTAGNDFTAPAGIQVSAVGNDSKITVRNSTISNNKRHGVIIDGLPQTVDFGTSANRGNNEIKNNRTNGPTTYWEISDSRGNSGTIIELVGTTLQENTTLAGLMTCDGTPTKCQFANAGINYWRILTPGNSIRLTNP